jgi:hypothetical protein
MINMPNQHPCIQGWNSWEKDKDLYDPYTMHMIEVTVFNMTPPQCFNVDPIFGWRHYVGCITNISENLKSHQVQGEVTT